MSEYQRLTRIGEGLWSEAAPGVSRDLATHILVPADAIVIERGTERGRVPVERGRRAVCPSDGSGTVSDRYTRVIPDAYGFERSPDGGCKVVPADAIVIERGKVPEVEDYSHQEIAVRDVYATRGDAPDWYWARGLRYLALAEYLRTHPPVDEAEVERLADVLCVDAGHEHQGRPECSAKAQARRLYLAGIRAPGVTE